MQRGENLHFIAKFYRNIIYLKMAELPVLLSINKIRGGTFYIHHVD